MCVMSSQGRSRRAWNSPLQHRYRRRAACQGGSTVTAAPYEQQVHGRHPLKQSRHDGQERSEQAGSGRPRHSSRRPGKWACMVLCWVPWGMMPLSCHVQVAIGSDLGEPGHSTSPARACKWKFTTHGVYWPSTFRHGLTDIRNHRILHHVQGPELKVFGHFQRALPPAVQVLHVPYVFLRQQPSSY